jgi:hypothetical protein
MNTTSFATVLKTYYGDLDYVERLIPTYQLHNKDNIPLYLIVPDSDYKYFKSLINKRNYIDVITDEEVSKDYVNALDYPELKSSIGIINAGVSKLSFWETKLADNYFAIDSDMVFIRDFYLHDFIDRDGLPFIALSAYPELKTDNFYFHRYWNSRDTSYQKVKEIIGLKNNQNLNTHNSQVMSSLILQDFKKNFLTSLSWTYADAMIFERYEFFWYAAWAQKSKVIEINIRHDFVKMIQHQGEHLMFFNAGFRESDFSRDYIGIIVNSNWSRQYGIIDFDKPPVEKYNSIGAWAEWNKKLNKT